MNRVLTSFTRGEKGIIAFVLAMVGVGYGILDYQERQREVTVFQVREDRPDGAVPVVTLPKGVGPEGQIDVNTADKAVLETLPGVGPAMADRIMQHRTQHGPIRSMADLDAVPGIGPAMMAKLSPLVAFGEVGTTGTIAEPHGGVGGGAGDGVGVAGAAMSAGGVAPVMAGVAPQQMVMPQMLAPAQVSRSGVAAAANGPVNINTAGPEELDRLNGVGPALAQRIILDRQRMGPYRSAQDLMRVKGIGPAIMRKNLGKITTQ